MTDNRNLIDLVSVGKVTVGDLAELGITRVDQLVGKDARRLKARLEKRRGVRLDPCVQDVFSAAIAQAEDPNLPPEQCQWPYWSRVRKANADKRR